MVTQPRVQHFASGVERLELVVSTKPLKTQPVHASGSFGCCRKSSESYGTAVAGLSSSAMNRSKASLESTISRWCSRTSLARAVTVSRTKLVTVVAMMLLHDSRREARFRDGDLVLLADQDRSLWDTEQIASGRAVLERALALRGRDPYVVQAAIASLHADEPRDWPQIAALYGELARLTGSPVAELNRAGSSSPRGLPLPALDEG